MNFLAHLYLAGDDEELMLGALLGDFVRGRDRLKSYEPSLRRGILLHRHIDSHIDTLPAFDSLRSFFQPPFRRYSGIIIDLGLDHELAKHWTEFSPISLDRFDAQVRTLLERNSELVPQGLDRFMAYADRRGLFSAYADSGEILHSLTGVGKRLSRPNPLHRVAEVWDGFEPVLAAKFKPLFDDVQSEVTRWLKSKSTITGS
jgi:acyl carrier protein phosphodiesterase